MTGAEITAGLAVLNFIERVGMSIVQVQGMKAAGITDEQIAAAVIKTEEISRKHRELDLRTHQV